MKGKKIFTGTIQEVLDKEKKVCITKSNNIIKDANEMILFLLGILDKMKLNVIKNGFNSEQEEIYFFKKIKPEICGKILFYKKVIEIEILLPKCSLQSQINYYEEKMNNILSDYYSDDFHKYILLGLEDKDYLYFLRKNSNYDVTKNNFFLK